ncbi:MAG: imidazolonepropionase, partial [Candidatus Cloacimonetes bacterium]|nr:imidazolonepropionase [Candidatus Cloacimonadota bacterium]
MQVDLIIYNAREIATLKSDGRPKTGSAMNDAGIIKDGALAIKDGLIVALGSSSEIRKTFQAGREIDASEKLITPGFVDSHTHPVFVHTREDEFAMRLAGKSYVEIALAGGGIRSSIASTRDASEDELFALAQKRISKMITLGTTTLEAKSGYGLSTESELKQLRVIQKLKDSLDIDIVATFMGAHEYPAEYKNDHEAYLRILETEMIPAVAKQA